MALGLVSGAGYVGQARGFRVMGAAPPVTLEYVAIGAGSASAAGAASVAPAPPAHDAGDLLILVVGIHTSGTKTVTIPALPAQWLAVSNGEGLGGSGTFGANDGPSRVKVMSLVAPDTAVTAITVTLPGTEGSSIAWAQILAFRSSSGVYDVDGAFGVDTTAGTPWTAAMNVDPGFAAGDLVVTASCTGTLASSFSNQTLTASGMTCTLTERAEFATSAGFDLEGNICTGEVTAGPSSAVATYSADAAATNTTVSGPIVVARIRGV